MRRVRGRKPSPAMIVAIIAVVFAVAGTSVAGVAAISTLSKQEKKQTRNIAKGEINKAAPSLSVANALNASSAANAANAAKVSGAGICSGVISLVNNEVRTVCGSAPVSIEASCGVNPTFTSMSVDVVSTTSDAWAFGTRTNNAADPLDEALINNSSETLVDAVDTQASQSVANGAGAFVSAGAPGGPSINGEFSVQVNHRGTNQGTCLLSMGAIVR